MCVRAQQDAVEALTRELRRCCTSSSRTDHIEQNAPSSMLPQPRASASSKTGHDRDRDRDGPRATTAMAAADLVPTANCTSPHLHGAERAATATDLSRRRPWTRAADLATHGHGRPRATAAMVAAETTLATASDSRDRNRGGARGQR